ncbi:MAG: hypothetical protein V3U22_05800 [Vicinamibacteria bacterium]
MQLATTLLLLTLQGSQFEPPVTVRCELDTELPLEEIRVSIAEKRETEGFHEPNGGVMLPGLPAGDIHLSFFQRGILLGDIEIRSANHGDFVRLKIRLVTGNAILLDEFRVKGVSPERGTLAKPLSVASANTIRTSPESDSVQKSEPAEPVLSRPRPPRSAKKSSSQCPDPGDSITRTGKLSRIIDNDSFELLGSARRSYVVYVGSATRLKRGSTLVAYSALREGLGILVKGTVAAGPEDECSIGAREVILQRH